MNVEIWSDVICQFCYIGKQNFEEALAQFHNKEKIVVIWKSFQLDSSMPEVAVNLNLSEGQHCSVDGGCEQVWWVWFVILSFTCQNDSRINFCNYLIISDMLFEASALAFILKSLVMKMITLSTNKIKRGGSYGTH